MCRDNRSSLLPWQAPYSRRGHPGHLALLHGACGGPLAGAHAHHHGPRGRAKRHKQEGAPVEPARDFAPLHLQCVDQIQWRYELIRPLVLFAEGTPTQRAEDTHTHPDTVRTFLRRFRQEGMLGLLPTDIEVAPRPRASRVPEAVRQDMAPAQSPPQRLSVSGNRPDSLLHVRLPPASQDCEAALAAEPAGHTRRMGVG